MPPGPEAADTAQSLATSLASRTTDSHKGQQYSDADQTPQQCTHPVGQRAVLIIQSLQVDPSALNQQASEAFVAALTDAEQTMHK